MDPAESSARRALAGWPYALLLLAGLIVLLPRLGEYGFWDPWEPKYGESVREMLERDSYFVPYYRDDVRLAKPILVYWAIIAGSSVFGFNEFGARIGGVVAALAALCGVYYAVSRLRNRRSGLLAALVLLSVPYFFFVSRQAMPDVYLFTSLGCSLLFFCLGLFRPERRADLHFGISYACVALAVLAKGPFIVALVFGVPLLIYASISIEWGQLWVRSLRRRTAGVLAMAAAGSLVLSASATVAALFLTAPSFWSESDEQLWDLLLLRRQIAFECERLYLPELLLLLGAAAALVAAAFTVWRARGALRVLAFALAGLAGGLAVLALLFGGSETRILAASALTGAAAVSGIAYALWRLLRDSELWPRVQPNVRFAGRQVLLFLLVFLVVAGPWHIGIVLEQGPEYFSYFLLKHNLQRASTEINQGGAADYYFRTLVFGFFPWSCFLPLALAYAAGLRRPSLFRPNGYETYLWLAAAVTFAGFSAATTKFPHYLTPLLIPLAVLIGITLDRMLAARHPQGACLVWILATLLYLPAMLDLLQEGGSKYLLDVFTVKRFVPDDLQPGAYSVTILALFAVGLLLSIFVRSRILVGGLVLSALLFARDNTSTFIPAVSPHKTMKHLCETWKNRGGDAPIGFYGDLKHGIYYYTESRIQLIDDAREFVEFMAPDRRAFCIVEKKLYAGLGETYRKSYPHGTLGIVDRSHFDYILITNSREGE